LRRKTHEEYVQELKDKGIKIIPLERYVSVKKKILHRGTCGNEWTVTPNNILWGQKCSKCVPPPPRIITITDEEYQQRIKEINPNITVLEAYDGFSTSIKHQCTCGRIFKAMPRNVMRDVACKCEREKRKLVEYNKRKKRFLSTLRKLNYGVEPLEEFKDAFSKMIFKCSCGTVFEATTREVMYGAKCGCGVGTSTGELQIETYLKDQGITYRRQQPFRDLRSPKKGVLKYDFSILYKDNVLCLIEYHGIQHFKYVPHFYQEGIEKFHYRQLCDQLKRQYAIDKDIPLIEIRYDQDTIPTLEAELQKLGIGQNVEQLVLF